MDYELPISEYHAVGPVVDMYGHGPVTAIGDHIVVCLDCGFTHHDQRMLLHEECDREENGINQSWRERLEEYGLAGLDDRQPDNDDPA